MEGDRIFTDTEDIVWDTETLTVQEGFMEGGDALSLTTDILEILLEDSDRFGVGNVIGLSKDNVDKW